MQSCGTCASIGTGLSIVVHQCYKFVVCIRAIISFSPHVQVLVESKCFMCDKELSCTVRDVLFQPDFGGHDYESGAMDATFR